MHTYMSHLNLFTFRSVVESTGTQLGIIIISWDLSGNLGFVYFQFQGNRNDVGGWASMCERSERVESPGVHVTE